jgi:ribosomal protein L16 Arg81 hydroxylase
MEIYDFSDFVGDEDKFFTDYFNVKPLLRQSAITAAAVRDILSIRELDQLLQLEVIRPPYIKANLNGEGVPEMGYTENVVIQGATVTDVVIPEKVYSLYRAGATLTWCSLNQVTPTLRSFTRIISDKMAVRTDSVAFLTPAGKKGYLPHHDPVDLFIVQLEGTKAWKLWNPGPDRLGTAEGYTEEALGEPAIETVLGPGDILYLPYGTPHAAAALDEASLHLSIMMRPRRWQDLLMETVERMVEAPEFYDYPHIGAARTQATEAEFSAKMSLLAAKMAELAPAAELNRLAQVGRQLPGSSSGTTFQSITTAENLGAASALRRTTKELDFGPNVSGRVELTVSGGKVVIPAPLADRLAALSVGAFVPASQVIPEAAPERSVKAARALVRAGVLEVVAGA